MEGPPVTLLQAWIPTLVTTSLLVLAGLLLGMKIDRDDRRAEEERKKTTA